MSERVVEILIYIMSEIRRNRNVSQKLDVVSQDLIQQGYTEGEISSALTWLLDRAHTEGQEVIEKQGPALKQSFRHLHEIESTVIETEAYGYIIQLKELGLIDALGFEQVIERSMMLGTSKVTVEDIKTVVASMLFSSEGFWNGSFFLFEDNPTIN